MQRSEVRAGLSPRDSGVPALGLAVRNQPGPGKGAGDSLKEGGPEPVSGPSQPDCFILVCGLFTGSTDSPELLGPFGTFQNRMQGPPWIWRNSVLG